MDSQSTIEDEPVEIKRKERKTDSKKPKKETLPEPIKQNEHTELR